MQNRPGALATYNRVSNMESNPVQQVVMLYNGAIKFLRLAAADIEAKDYTAKAEHSARALDIIQYLQSVLDFERGADVARTLDSLYTVITAMVLKASLSLDARLMRRAADLLLPVSDAWALNAQASLGRDNAGAFQSRSSAETASLNKMA